MYPQVTKHVHINVSPTLSTMTSAVYEDLNGDIMKGEVTAKIRKLKK